MRNILLAAALCFCATQAGAQDYALEAQSGRDGRHQVSFTLASWELQKVTVDGVDYQKISFEAPTVTDKKGWAELPYVTANICVDDQKPISAKIVGAEYKDYALDAPMLPSRGVIYRNQDPNSIPYVVDAKSVVDEFYPAVEAQENEPYIVRDVRGVSVHFYPFRYNAATGTLRVYTSITVEVAEGKGVGKNPLRKKGKLFGMYNGMYKSMFLNYDGQRAPLPVQNEFGDILVVTTARDTAGIAPYIQWKREKGFNVDMLVVNTGTNIVASGNNLIQAAYNENPDLMFVQIVGDWNDVKCNMGGGENAPMDPMIGCVVGTDNFPDIAVGRFSVQSQEHLATQVNKTIQYERDPDMGDWYSSAVSIASNEGTGSGDDGESDQQHQQNIYDHRLSQDTYTTQYAHYQAVSGTATASALATSVNTGVSIINYTGHGSETTFVTTGFSNNNIANLTNGVKMPFIFSVACVNGAFHRSSDCFAEAWLRKQNGGAIATYMSTINQPWVPPMAGQDYFNDIITGGYDYTSNPGNGTSTEERRTLFGAVHVNGQVLMLQQNATGQWLETAQTWTIFGDASLQVRTATPQVIETSGTVMMMGAEYEATITAGGVPVAGAMVCLSQNGNYARAMTNEQGAVVIENIFEPGDVMLTVTAFNCTTIHEAIQCVPAEGPYLVLRGCQVQGGNAVAYGSTADIDLTFKNVGIEVAAGCVATITCDNPNVTIASNEFEMGDVAVDATATFEGAFTVTVSDNVANGEQLQFGITVDDNAGNTWQATGRLVAKAPILSIAGIEFVETVGNDNGGMDAGEFWEAIITVENAGEVGTPEVEVTFASLSQYASVVFGSGNIAALDAASTGTLTCQIMIAAEVPLGFMAQFAANATAGNYAAAEFVVGRAIGLVVEDFESGDFSSYNWDTSLANAWVIETDASKAYEGSYAMASADINNNGTSTIILRHSVVANDSISFMMKVSSEANYDKVQFYINNVSKGQWSGNLNWSRYAFPVTPNDSLFKWVYTKDGSVDGGDDRIWVDYLVLPGGEAGSPSTNHAPSFVSQPDSVYAVYSGETFRYDIVVEDEDGDEIEISAVQLPGWVSLTQDGAGAAHVEGTPAAEDLEKVESVVLRAFDGEIGVYQTFMIDTREPVGVADIAVLGSMTVYPNPCSGSLRVELSSVAARDLSLELLTLDGRLARSIYSGSAADAPVNFEGDVNGLATGVYLLRVMVDGHATTQKIVVAR